MCMLQADVEVDVAAAAAAAAAGQPKKRTFKKFSFRGVDLDALLDMSTDELVKMFSARARRRFQRGLTRKPMALIKKLRKAVCIYFLSVFILFFCLWYQFASFWWNRKGKHQQVRSQNQFAPISATWLLCLRWLVASLESTMARPSTRLKSNPRWLDIISLSSLFHTNPSSTVGLVLVPLTLPGSFLSSEKNLCKIPIFFRFCFYFQLPIVWFIMTWFHSINILFSLLILSSSITCSF